MGLPTNQAKGQGCSPVSSNCVIWQGPDIPCINLCHGDSVTDVTAKLATELCDILKTLDINTYDIDCFKPICPDPENFHDLIQFLITKVCELQCCCDGTKPSESDCPDKCIVTVCPEFYYPNQLGDTITTMTLAEYVIAIGNKLCTILPKLNLNTTAVTTLQNQQAANGQRFNDIEEELEAVTITLPASCLYPEGTSTNDGVGIVAQALCDLQAATGTPIQLLTSVSRECANLAQSKSLANRSVNMGSLAGWSPNNITVADTINHMWLTICDLRAALQNVLATCCCTDCDDVNITMTASLSANTVTLFFTGSIPAGLTDCFPSGCFVTITDANGGSYSTYVEVVNNLNGSVNIDLTNTPVNVSTTLTITLQGCWNRPAPGSDCGGLRCERILTYQIVNSPACPTLEFEFATTSISYSFLNTVNPGSLVYNVKLYASDLVTLIYTQSTANPLYGATVSGTFTPTLGSTSYYVVVEVVLNGVTTTCPQILVTTPPYNCAPVTSLTATPVPII